MDDRIPQERPPLWCNAQADVAEEGTQVEYIPTVGTYVLTQGATLDLYHNEKGICVGMYSGEKEKSLEC